MQGLNSNTRLSDLLILLQSWGITTYDLDSKSGKFVFPSAGSLYGCLDNTQGIKNCQFVLKKLLIFKNM